MRGLLLLVILVIVVVVGLKAAGVELPFIDYPIGPMGEGQGPGMPDIRVEPPGFDEFPAP